MSRIPMIAIDCTLLIVSSWPSEIPMSANDCLFTSTMRLVGIDDVGGWVARISSLVGKLRAYYLV